MRSTLNRRYRMCLSVRDVLNAYVTVQDSVPGLKERSQDFFKQLQVLDAGTTLGIEGTQGYTEAKNLLRERLADSCFSLANAVWSHAAETNDEVLKARVPVIYTVYRFGREVDILGRYRAVWQEANTLQDAILKYGIRQEQLNQIQDDIEMFAQRMNSPKATRSSNALKLADFITDFRKMDDVLDRLDRSVNVLKAQERDFFNAYTRARYLGTPTPRGERDEEMPVEKVVSAPMRELPQPATSEGDTQLIGSAMGRVVARN